MPELPEVETIAASLRKKIKGAVVARIEIGRIDFVRDPHGAAPSFVGRRVAAVLRQGKRITIRLEPSGTIVCHLGMTGRIQVLPAQAPAASHTHARIQLDDGTREIRFRDPRRFGGVWIDDRGDSAELPPLGPDALGVSLAAFKRMLARARQIKALLLDQRTISGLGNIYCDEALFTAGIHPQSLASRIPGLKAKRLHGALQRILRDAIRNRGSTLRDYATVEGGSGRFQLKHLVYGREGSACVHCGATIRRILAAGRSSHICARCQRAPRRTG